MKKRTELNRKIVVAINNLNVVGRKIINNGRLREDGEYENNEMLFKDTYQYKEIKETLRACRVAITPPTADEVCEALNEYKDFDFVRYENYSFYSGDTICYLGFDGVDDEPLIIFNYELPPHLITLIGRFYEGLEK